MKITVIMPCYLGDYHGAAKERKNKLKRAINSFLQQDYIQRELIVVADGDEETVNFIRDEEFNETAFGKKKDIIVSYIEKQPLFSGNVREQGLKLATGHIVTYLDADDFYKNNNHLTNIVNGFTPGIDWVYFNHYIKFFPLDHLPMEQLNADIQQGSIGTSNIAHGNLPGISWEGCDSYGHDFMFIQKMARLYSNYKKIDDCSYVVCHVPNSFDN